MVPALGGGAGWLGGEPSLVVTSQSVTSGI